MEYGNIGSKDIFEKIKKNTNVKVPLIFDYLITKSIHSYFFMTVLNIVAKQWEDIILVKLLGFDGIKIMIPDPFYLKTVFIMNLILIIHQGFILMMM